MVERQVVEMLVLVDDIGKKDARSVRVEQFEALFFWVKTGGVLTGFAAGGKKEGGDQAKGKSLGEIFFHKNQVFKIGQNYLIGQNLMGF